LKVVHGICLDSYSFIVDVAARNFKSWGQRDSVGTVVGNALLGRFDLAPITVLEYKNDDADFRGNPTDLIASNYKFNIEQAATNVKSVFETAYEKVLEKAMAAGVKDNRYVCNVFGHFIRRF
jgi:hypothetical protein